MAPNNCDLNNEVVLKAEDSEPPLASASIRSKFSNNKSKSNLNVNTINDGDNYSLAHSGTPSFVTTISQDELAKLVSFHVSQELSKFPSFGNGDDYDDEDEDEEPSLGRLQWRNFKSKCGSLNASISKYVFIRHLSQYRSWYNKKAANNRFLEVLGSAGWFVLLYPCIFAGIVIGAVAPHQTIAVFVLNVLALVPLSVLITYVTECVAHRTNAAIGSLVNITFGNSIELVFSILALIKGQLSTVQGSMVGSWLATTQLILGASLFCASFNKKQLKLNTVNCYFNVIFMVFSGFIFKMVYSINDTSESSSSTSENPSKAIVNLSTGLAILHLLLYVVYLMIPYQHKRLLDNEMKDIEKGPSVTFSPNNVIENEVSSQYMASEGLSDDMSALSDSNTAVSENTKDESKNQVSDSRALIIYIILLFIITVLAAFNSDYLLDSLNDFSDETHIPKPLLVTIVLPIFSNSAEHVTSVIVASKGQLELALNVALGSAVQINFMIVPILVLIARATKSPYTFLYDGVYTETMFAAAIIASFCIFNGRSYFATGSVLLISYICMAVIIGYLK